MSQKKLKAVLIGRQIRLSWMPDVVMPKALRMHYLEPDDRGFKVKESRADIKPEKQWYDLPEHVALDKIKKVFVHENY